MALKPHELTLLEDVAGHLGVSRSAALVKGLHLLAEDLGVHPREEGPET